MGTMSLLNFVPLRPEVPVDWGVTIGLVSVNILLGKGYSLLGDLMGENGPIIRGIFEVSDKSDFVPRS
jgi:hypothetical protein